MAPNCLPVPCFGLLQKHRTETRVHRSAPFLPFWVDQSISPHLLEHRTLVNPVHRSPSVHRATRRGSLTSGPGDTSTRRGSKSRRRRPCRDSWDIPRASAGGTDGPPGRSWWSGRSGVGERHAAGILEKNVKLMNSQLLPINMESIRLVQQHETSHRPKETGPHDPNLS